MRLIIGSDGLIGKSIAKDWHRHGISYHASTRRKELVSIKRPFIDLKYPSDISQSENYNIIVITAAMSGLHECEKNPKLTRGINVVNTFDIVKKLSDSSTYIVFFSSNQVFDGVDPFKKSTDKKKPITEYGKQKSEIEDLLLEYSNNVCIIRMTKIMYSNMPLIMLWKKSLLNSRTIHPFYDMRLAPVSIAQAIGFTNSLILKRSTGIHHLPSKEDMTYEELAYKICHSIGADKGLISPISYSAILPSELNFPNYSSLI
jgi:dTDP-4-dehydrorhamnose reductase